MLTYEHCQSSCLTLCMKQLSTKAPSLLHALGGAQLQQSIDSLDVPVPMPQSVLLRAHEASAARFHIWL